jgi:hypothetical protein
MGPGCNSCSLLATSMLSFKGQKSICRWLRCKLIPLWHSTATPVTRAALDCRWLNVWFKQDRNISQPGGGAGGTSCFACIQALLIQFTYNCNRVRYHQTRRRPRALFLAGAGALGSLAGGGISPPAALGLSSYSTMPLSESKAMYATCRHDVW